MINQHNRRQGGRNLEIMRQFMPGLRGFLSGHLDIGYPKIGFPREQVATPLSTPTGLIVNAYLWSQFAKCLLPHFQGRAYQSRAAAIQVCAEAGGFNAWRQT